MWHRHSCLCPGLCQTPTELEGAPPLVCKGGLFRSKATLPLIFSVPSALYLRELCVKSFLFFWEPVHAFTQNKVRSTHFHFVHRCYLLCRAATHEHAAGPIRTPPHEHPRRPTRLPPPRPRPGKPQVPSLHS